MILGKHFLGMIGLRIGYTKAKKMSKTIFIRNKLDFGGTPFVDDNSI